MPLNAGDPAATGGLARDIYDVLDAELRPSLEAGLEKPEEQLKPIQDAWRTLSFCIASGVVEHLMRVPPSEPEYAQTFTSSAHDATYWAWLAAFAKVFRDWASGAGTIADLRNALNAFFAANPTPTQLRGILQ
jgi:hypothetical protein